MLELSKDRTEKKQQVKKLFDEFVMQGMSETQAIKQIVKETKNAISERSVWNYKNEWEGRQTTTKVTTTVKTTTKTKSSIEALKTLDQAARSINAQMYTKSIDQIQWMDVNKQYEPEFIKEKVSEVCSQMTIGNIGLMQILDNKGITLFLWNKWIDNDPDLYLIYTKAKEQQERSFFNRIHEAMKRVVMLYLTYEDITEETIMYEFVKELDPEDESNTINKEVPKYRTVKRKPQKPDAQTIKTVLSMMNEMMRSTMTSDTEDINKMLAMSEPELKQFIADAEREREGRDAN